MLENIAAMSKQNHKCLKLLPADAVWNNEKDMLRQPFSLVPTVMYAGT